VQDFLFRDRLRDAAMGGSRAWLRAVLLGVRHPTRGFFDRLNPPNIAAITFAFRSLMTALCGMASWFAKISRRDDR
jgi:hypothetical protein